MKQHIIIFLYSLLLLCNGIVITTPTPVNDILIIDTNLTEYINYNITIVDNLIIESNQYLTNISFPNLITILNNLTII